MPNDPNDLYIGIAIGVVILILIASLFRRKPGARRTAQNTRNAGNAQTGSANVSADELKVQLSRIADSLGRIEAHLGISSPRLQPMQQISQSSAPVAIAPPQPMPASAEPATGQQVKTAQIESEQITSAQEKPEEEKSEQPKENKPASHVSLSMFGR